MKSKTKLYISPADVRKAFSAAGFHTVSDIAPLTAGEFNSAYCVTADAAQYVLKVAPQKDSAHTLTYETDLMRQEVFFYQQIRAKTDVRVPQIFYSDFSCSLLPSAFFIMEKLQGQPLTACRLSGAERTAMHEQIGELLAKLHTIRGEQYGYVQNGLYPNWYLAVRSMTENVLADCEKIGKRCKAGEQVLLLIEQNRALLETVPCVYRQYNQDTMRFARNAARARFVARSCHTTVCLHPCAARDTSGIYRAKSSTQGEAYFLVRQGRGRSRRGNPPTSGALYPDCIAYTF